MGEELLFSIPPPALLALFPLMILFVNVGEEFSLCIPPPSPALFPLMEMLVNMGEE